MSNSLRKIKAEIDKTHKKIREGFDVFQSLWDKVEDATDHSSKQRWTAELKKELKKLQRMRDQIKGWLSNGAVKDTSDLEHHKSEIESKMELFKDLERDVKTKAYMGSSDDEEEFDRDADPELTEVVDWISETVDTLQDQLSEYQETLDEEMRMGKRADQEVVDRFQTAIEQNKWHVENLESILQLCYDGEVTASIVSRIRDDVEYYVESHMDEDFFADEGAVAGRTCVFVCVLCRGCTMLCRSLRWILAHKRGGLEPCSLCVVGVVAWQGCMTSSSAWLRRMLCKVRRRKRAMPVMHELKQPPLGHARRPPVPPRQKLRRKRKQRPKPRRLEKLLKQQKRKKSDNANWN